MSALFALSQSPFAISQYSMASTTSGDMNKNPALLETKPSKDIHLATEHDSVASTPSGSDVAAEGSSLSEEIVPSLPVRPTRPERLQAAERSQPQPPQPQPQEPVDIFALYEKTQKAKRLFLGAVENGDLELIKSLIPQHDRVQLTQALGQAVDQQTYPVVEVLLEHGVRCDFEESDRPAPVPAYPSHGWFNEDETEPDNWIPPLVRAVNLGNIGLVRLLVAHGADVNGGYHDLRWARSKSLLFCGRPVQLAMALKRVDIVVFLVESGADINLQHPAWYHDCPRSKGKILRAVHLRVRAGLRAEVHRLEEEKEITGRMK
ncbi:hypothetical protein B0J14DRAFT_84256 [Halenospora varia]|nr:hypothetical protein B0J14DRAFT_84256 [Halenospora varia]